MRTPDFSGTQKLWRHVRPVDYLLAALLAFAAWIVVFTVYGDVTPLISRVVLTNVWYDGDPAQIVEAMTQVRSTHHFRAQAHPLFFVFCTPPGLLLTRLGLSPLAATRIIFSFIGAAWVSGIYAVVRRLEWPAGTALLFTLFALSSASALLWLPVPETHTFGSLGILIVLLLITGSPAAAKTEGTYTMAVFWSMAGTITNGASGAFAALTSLKPRRALRSIFEAVGMMSCIWAVQTRIFKHAPYFLSSSYISEYLHRPSLAGVWTSVTSLLVYSIVLPPPTVRQDPLYPKLVLISVAGSAARPLSIPGWIGVILWLALLLLGAAGVYRIWKDGNRQLPAVLGASLLVQLALHTIYGAEPLLYAMNTLSVLIPVAACAREVRASRFVPLLLACGIVFNLVNNIPQWLYSRELARVVASRTPDLPDTRGH